MGLFIHNSRSAFTLLELSIVLVIIGLIVGGVLVGRDLIKSSEIRATISQIEEFRTANQTFRLKYNALPGDMLVDQAGQLGFFQLTSGYGNGNGLIDGAFCSQEALVYWQHLSQAGLVKGNFGTQSGNAINPADGRPTGAAPPIDQSVPRSRISNRVYFPVTGNIGGFPIATRNAYALYNFTTFGSAACGSTAYAVAPMDLYTMDQKMDDALPETGTVLSWGQWGATASSGVCHYGGASPYATDNVYNIASGTNTTLACFAYFLF